MGDERAVRVADYVADFVARLGVRHVFLLPGGGAMHLIDAFGKNSGLKAVPCLHEQACSIAAEAYSRVNENIGVAVVTTGPGATNAITGVAGAWIESVPLLVISGQVKRPDLLNGAPLRQKGVQEVDIVSMVRPITKYASIVSRPEDIRIELEKAVFLARDGRQGPVWIDIPLDVQGAPIDPALLAAWNPNSPSGGGPRLEDDIEKLILLLQASSRPLILAGHGIRLSGGTAVFRELVESTGIPVVTTWNAMDLLPASHPQAVGRPGAVALRAPNFAVQNCDLLISIGCRLDNIVTAYNPAGFARNAKRVMVDIDQNEIEKLNIAFDLKIVSDAKLFLEGLLKKAPVHSSPRYSKWNQRCMEWKEKFSLAYERSLVPSGGSDSPLSHYDFVEALSDKIPENTLISTGSSGLAIEVFYSVFRNKPGQRIFLTSGLGAMGYGLPAGIGACFANDRKPMIAIESDGSLQLNIQELATVRASNLPLCLIILNNGGYASIRNTQRNYFDGRYVGTGPEAGLWLPDLERIAAAYEIKYHRIESVAQLEELDLRVDSPTLIDVRLVKDEALAPKVSALPQADGSMLSMPLEDMSPLLSLDQLRDEMIAPLLEVSTRARERARL